MKSKTALALAAALQVMPAQVPAGKYAPKPVLNLEESLNLNMEKSSSVVNESAQKLAQEGGLYLQQAETTSGLSAVKKAELQNKALDSFEAAIKVDPQNFLANYGKGTICLHASQDEDNNKYVPVAILHLEKALAFIPQEYREKESHLSVLEGLAKAYFRVYKEKDELNAFAKQINEIGYDQAKLSRLNNAFYLVMNEGYKLGVDFNWIVESKWEDVHAKVIGALFSRELPLEKVLEMIDLTEEQKNLMMKKQNFTAHGKLSEDQANRIRKKKYDFEMLMYFQRIGRPTGYETSGEKAEQYVLDLAKLYLKAGDLEHAEGWTAIAIQQLHDSYKARELMGNIYQAGGLQKKADEQFERAEMLKSSKK